MMIIIDTVVDEPKFSSHLQEAAGAECAVKTKWRRTIPARAAVCRVTMLVLTRVIRVYLFYQECSFPQVNSTTAWLC